MLEPGHSVQAELVHDWDGSQRILGPYLIVPYALKTQRLVDGRPWIWR
jgi:inner membrane protein involved in colicin E2 resistance